MRSDEMSVMLLCGANGLVPKQLLNRANIRPGGEQFDRKGVSESVRVRVDLGYHPKALDRAPKVLDAGNHVAVPGPKKVLRILRGQRVQRIHSLFIEQNFLVDPGFQYAQRQMPPVQGGSLKGGDVRDAQPRVKQNVHESAGTSAHVVGFFPVRAEDIGRGAYQPHYLVAGKWLSDQILNKRHSDLAGGVTIHPSAFNAPREERANSFKFFTPRAGRNLSGLPVSVEHDGINGIYLCIAESSQVAKRLSVRRQRGLFKVTATAGLQEIADGYRECWRWFLNAVPLHVFEFSQGDGGVVGSEALAQTFAVQCSVAPNWARTEAVGLALATVRAGGDVTTVSSQWHCGILSGVVRDLVHGDKMSEKPNKRWRKPVGVVLSDPTQYQQVTDSANSPDSPRHPLYAGLYVCTIPLSGGRAVAIADAEDAEMLSAYNWYLFGGYAKGRRKGTSDPLIGMHRLISRPSSAEMVDHANGNTLDNRRENLRNCRNHENLRNAGMSRSEARAVPFKGVSMSGPRRFRAKIFVEGRQVYLGSFGSAEEAARAYDASAVQHFGQFARLNFAEITAGGAA